LPPKKSRLPGLFGVRRKPRLILHAGTHKTGTTTIQSVLAANRTWLADHGLIYPEGGDIFPGNRPHHKWSHALTGVPAREPNKVGKYLAYTDALAAGRGTILISAEPLYRHVQGIDEFPACPPHEYWERRARYVENCAAALRGYDVTVVIWFREKASFARSLFAEMRRKGRVTGNFESFVEAYANWMDYDRHLALFRRFFERVEVGSFEESVRKGLAAAFFSTIGFPMPPGADVAWERRTDYSELAGLLPEQQTLPTVSPTGTAEQ
jgi:hypothetical protein